VEFEQGDVDRPVMVGGLWGEGEAPPPASPDHKVLRSEASAIELDDSPGGGITIDSSSIRINGKAIFSRSGVMTIPPGASAATVTDVDLTAGSLVLATLQDDLPTVLLRAAVPDPRARTITLYLTRSAGRSGARVAWLVVG